MPFVPTWPMPACKARSLPSASSPARRRALRSPVADVLKEPAAGSGINTQFLFGDDVLVFEAAGGFAWVQAERDGYVGYVRKAILLDASGQPTHIVSVPRTFLYPGPDLRFPRAGQLSMGSAVTVTGAAETRGTQYVVLASGQAVIAKPL